MIKKSVNADKAVAGFVVELMDASIKFHILHLSITGPGSFSIHKALNDLYEALPDHADSIAESYQGASGELLKYPADMPASVCAPAMTTVKDAIAYIDDLHAAISNLQSMISYSEIVNDLDTIKSTLNSAKYKLKFLS